MTDKSLGIADVRQAMVSLGMQDTILEFDSPTATSHQAAQNAGCALGQIVKSLGFIINRTTPILVLACGDQFVDDRKLAALHGVGRKKARLMTAEQCQSILGYAPGAVPPICHRTADVAVILDSSLRRFELVYASGGAANAIFPIAVADLQRVTAGRFADIVKA